MNQQDTYYAAMLARDYRFDGKFFVGVRTTGIYCRPICPARPKRENIEFFPNHLAAERAGYRPCLRCRPESAPQSPVWIGKSAIVRRAIKILNSRDALEFDEDEFAALFGVSARHLRRVFMGEVGKTPKQLVFENRLALARKLIAETRLPVTEIAFAAGFRSIRRFNESFKERFKRNPSRIRRASVSKSAPLRLTVPYRPPFDFEGLIHFYNTHPMGSLERFEDGKMFRVIAAGSKAGEVAISNDPKNSRLIIELDYPDTSVLHSVITKVRGLFDLDVDPLLIANALEQEPGIRKLLKKYPGVRLPSGWDGFEIGVSTILGQLVSVACGRALVSDLIELLGEDSRITRDGKLVNVKLFPTPKKLAAADLNGLGTTRARKATLKEFARRVATGELSLEITQDVELFREKLMSIPGVGKWTADYMCLKVLRHTDALPASDLILARALELHPSEALERMSPWRGYVATLLWREYSETLKKSKRRKS